MKLDEERNTLVDTVKNLNREIVKVMTVSHIPSFLTDTNFSWDVLVIAAE